MHRCLLFRSPSVSLAGPRGWHDLLCVRAGVLFPGAPRSSSSSALSSPTIRAAICTSSSYPPFVGIPGCPLPPGPWYVKDTPQPGRRGPQCTPVTIGHNRPLPLLLFLCQHAATTRGGPARRTAAVGVAPPPCCALRSTPTCGVGWSRAESDGVGRSRLESIGIDWNRLESVGVDWHRLESVGIGWNRLDSVGIGWIRLEPIGIEWNRLESVGVGRGRAESKGVWFSFVERHWGSAGRDDVARDWQVYVSYSRSPLLSGRWAWRLIAIVNTRKLSVGAAGGRCWCARWIRTEKYLVFGRIGRSQVEHSEVRRCGVVSRSQVESDRVGRSWAGLSELTRAGQSQT
eukprot:gene3047-biopygen5156